MKNRLKYYILLLCIAIGYAQDPPLEFEFNQSTAQSFYSFSSFEILDIEFDQDDYCKCEHHRMCEQNHQHQVYKHVQSCE